MLHPQIPIRYYIYMVALFYVVQVVNNMALGYHISMPLHGIFRAVHTYFFFISLIVLSYTLIPSVYFGLIVFLRGNTFRQGLIFL